MSCVSDVGRSTYYFDVPLVFSVFFYPRFKVFLCNNNNSNEKSVCVVVVDWLNVLCICDVVVAVMFVVVAAVVRIE